MHTWVAVLIVSVLAVCPLMGAAGTAGQQPPERFCQISRQTGFWGWDMEPPPPRVSSKNGEL
jgi:hypothetical protein